MCGIAGIVHTDGRQVDASALQRMADAMSHRGPDGSGIWLDGGAGFAHRRLAIIDLQGGRQPMISGDSGCVLTFNGEIYNYRELRRTLAAEGLHFLEQSDTEVVLRAYEALGRAVRGPLPRDVRVCRVGSARPAAVCRAGSTGHQAAVLQVAAPDPDLCVRAESHSRGRSVPIGLNWTRAASIDICGCSTSPRRTPWWPAFASCCLAVLCAFRPTIQSRSSDVSGSTRAGRRSRHDRSPARSFERCRPEPHGGGRACGCAPLGRRRLQPGRRAHGARRLGSRSYLFGGIRRRAPRRTERGTAGR